MMQKRNAQVLGMLPKVVHYFELLYFLAAL